MQSIEIVLESIFIRYVLDMIQIRVVVYGSLEHENEIHVKPYWFFASSIDESDVHDVYIEQTYRFEEVSIVSNRITMMLEKYCKDWISSENEF